MSEIKYRPGINTLPEAEATTNERIIIRCPGCDKKLKARRGDIGKKARCSTCETKFRIRVDETDGREHAHSSEDPGATILGLPRDADHQHRDGERIAIGGDWISELGWGHDRVVVELDPDLNTLLTNGTSDPLWPNNGEYIEFVNSLDDPADYLRQQWTICYLHHPRTPVLTSALSLVGNRYRVSIGRQLAALLSYEAVSVRDAAAQALWAKGPLEIAAALRQLKERGAEGAQILLDHCPEADREDIDEMYQRNYTDWPEGVQDLDDSAETHLESKPDSTPES